MAFSEVREYNYGDDIRDIDWNVTARYNKPFIKIFEEEREMTVMLLIDVSGSLDFGTQNATKRDIVTEIAATLSFSAIQNNDKIGVIFFTNKIEKFIPPKKGKKHILYIIRELLDFQPTQTQTDLTMALKFLTNAIKKRCTAFLISDFLDVYDYQNALTIANRKHDLVALQIYDKLEVELPSVGLMKMVDAETQEETWVDTSSKKVRERYNRHYQKLLFEVQQSFTKSRVDNVSMSTDQDYVKGLLALFQKRNYMR